MTSGGRPCVLLDTSRVSWAGGRVALQVLRRPRPPGVAVARHMPPAPPCPHARARPDPDRLHDRAVPQPPDFQDVIAVGQVSQPKPTVVPGQHHPRARNPDPRPRHGGRLLADHAARQRPRQLRGELTRQEQPEERPASLAHGHNTMGSPSISSNSTSYTTVELPGTMISPAALRSGSAPNPRVGGMM